MQNLRSEFSDEVEQRIMLKLKTGLEPVTARSTEYSESGRKGFIAIVSQQNSQARSFGIRCNIKPRITIKTLLTQSCQTVK